MEVKAMAVFAAYYEARVVGRIHGQETINVWHFGSDSEAADQPALVLLMTQLAQAIIECVIDFWLPACTSDWTLEGCDVRRRFPNPSDPIEVSAPLNSVGQRQPVNTSFETVLLRLRTGLAGKSNRGRKFMPPPGDADITNSVLTSQPVNDFMTQFLDCMRGKFIAPGATTPFRMLIVSQKSLKNQPANWNLATNAVNQMNIEQGVTHLHSRKVGVGS